MTTDLELIAGLLLKSSALLTAVIALLLLLRKIEPRWRILLARATVLALPLLVAASLIAPQVALPWFTSAPLAGGVGASPLLLMEEAQLPSVTVNAGHRSGALEAPDFQPGALFWAGLLWVTVALLLAVPQVRRLWSVVAEARGGQKAPPRLQSRWKEICAEFGITRPPAICSVTRNCSPYLVGGREPALVVPGDWLVGALPGDVDHVLRHEAAHLRSGDSSWLPATRLLACLLWFQPLVWVLQVLHLRACEEAADAAAARRGGAESYRRALARLALELVPAGTAAPAAFLRVPSVVGRLRVVARHVQLRPPSRWRGVIAAGAVLLTGIALGNLGLAEKETATATSEAAMALKIDSIDFEDTSLTDALRMLQVAADGRTATDPDIDGKAFPYRLKLAKGVDGEVRVTLKLSHVPFGEALKYLTKLAGVSYRIEGRKIIVEKAGAGAVEKKQFVDAVAEGWESPAGDGIEAMAQMLKTQIIPTVDFADMPLKDAVAQLEQGSHEASGRKQGGVRMSLAKSVNADTQITLRLSNVPLREALRYVCALAQAKFTIGENGVEITAMSEPNADLYTNVYSVPKNAFPAVMPGGSIDAKATLEAVGVVFREGASAVYNSKTDQLIVRNTKHELELVKAWVEMLQQEAKESKVAEPGSPDPSDLWFRGYMLMKQGEEAEDARRIVEALVAYQQAGELFRHVAAAHPEFHPQIVRHRQNLLAEKIKVLSKTGEDLPEIAAGDGAKGTRETLADSLLEVRDVNCERHEGEAEGQRRTLSVDVVSDRPKQVKVSEINLMVYFYEIIGDERLEASTAETEISFPSAPYDWSGEKGVETIEVEYFLPNKTMQKDGRRYYGYIAELYYDGVLQHVSASPSKLMRIAP